MRNRTKKEQKELDSIMNLFVLVAGLVGWYKFESLKGVLIGAFIAIGILVLIRIWLSARFNKRMAQSGISEIDQMTGREFEEYLGVLFVSQDYDVTYTPVTGDFGADLILKKGKEVIVVQAKRYKSTVGIKAVQEVIPAVKMYNATKAWVISNSYYTKAAVKLAKHNDVRMIDRDELIQMSINVSKSHNESTENRINVNENIKITTVVTIQSSISNTDLTSKLKEFRLKTAKSSGLKAYHIFTNQTLDDLIEKRPYTIAELREVRGIGEKKIAAFGEELLKVIRG